MSGNLRVCGSHRGIRFVLLRGPIDDEDVDAAVAASAVDGAGGVLLFAPAVLRPPPPSAAQRARLLHARGIRGVRTAAVSESRGFRIVLKIMGWLGTPIAAFSQHEIGEAFAFLGVPDDAKPELMARAHEVLAMLSEPTTSEPTTSAPTTSAPSSQ